jgi:hypothetical protein
VPPPVIAGNYHGSFTSGGSGNAPMDLSISQSGGTRHFHIVENGSIDLLGVVVGPGHLSGSWGPNGSSDTWDVSLVPTIAGSYSGSWTEYGVSGNFPMQLQINQIGGVLNGTTNESGSIYNDAGTVTASGNLHMVETHNATSVDLYGSVVSSHHLHGTWGPSGGSGTWDVA